MNIDWPERGCVGEIRNFKLKTNTGNIYNTGHFVNFSIQVCYSLKPRETTISEWQYYFEIREDEVPTELWGYNTIGTPKVADQPVITINLDR